MKRSFVHREGVLEDIVQDEDGTVAHVHLPTSRLHDAVGVTVATQERGAFRGLSSGTRSAFVKALTGEARSLGVLLAENPPSPSREVDDAALSLIRLMGAPRVETRRRAVALAVDLVARTLLTRTAPLRHLECAVERARDDADLETFLFVAPWHYSREPLATLARCRSHLQSQRRRDRDMTALALTRFEPSHEAKALLLEHLPHEPSPRTQLWLTRYLGALVSDSARAEIVGRALSGEAPSLRYAAIEQLAAVSGPLRSSLIAVALADEPDLELRQRLRAQLPS